MTFALSALLTLAVGVNPPYVRSRVDTGIANDPNAHCLWWSAGTITYVQSTQGNPGTGPSAFTAVENAFASWQAVMNSCGSLTLKEGPQTPSRTVGYDSANPSANQNIVLFRQSNCSGAVPTNDSCWSDSSCGSKYDCWDHGADALALTTTTYDTVSGQIYDADIEVNAGSFIFTTVDSPPCPANNLAYNCVAYDIQSTVTHESGHLLGLAHDPDPTSIMYPSAPPGQTAKRTIDSGSQQFVCDVYPKGAPSRDCVVLPVTDQLKPSGCTQSPTQSSFEASWLFTLGVGFALFGRRAMRRPKIDRC